MMSFKNTVNQLDSCSAEDKFIDKKLAQQILHKYFYLEKVWTKKMLKILSSVQNGSCMDIFKTIERNMPWFSHTREGYQFTNETFSLNEQIIIQSDDVWHQW